MKYVSFSLIAYRSRFRRKVSSKSSPRKQRIQSEPFLGLENPIQGTRVSRRNSDPGTYDIKPTRFHRLLQIDEEGSKVESKKKDLESKMTRPQITKTNTFTLGDISENDDDIKRRQSIGEDQTDYRSEVDVEDFTAKEIKVIVGRNRVRIIGERAFGSLECSNGFHKVIQVPSNVDPLTLKSNLKDGKVIITGKYAHKNRKWTINNRGLMSVKDDGCARITIDLPKGIDPQHVQVKTITKHYLVVSNSPHSDLPKSPSTCKTIQDDIAEDFIETFELPTDCDLTSLSKRTMGESTVVVEFSSQTSHKSGSAPSARHRPRSFTL